MADDLPRLAPRAMKRTGKFVRCLASWLVVRPERSLQGRLGCPVSKRQFVEGVKEANPDYVTTGEVASPAVWPAILTNAASEIGTGIKNWWTGYDADKPVLKSEDDYIRELMKPVPTLAEYKAAAQEKVRNSSAYTKLLDERRNKAAAGLIDQAGKDAEKTYERRQSCDRGSQFCHSAAIRRDLHPRL